ncbi:hypothetical protein SAMN04488082_108109 [Desulfomicrobium apsheronum]|uniref:Uncharacterized protein n=1 Tax=Desulfomicrobium apsheronum TaxID=52560 RepID=A0A1I3UST5_9BACT|nr:hypothetical protein [Desulfomicrobium apsheronum]SFJ86002.1 hypothetical protein SAMN04488082_108109 [Desulfomicrobium apsheronum]
MSSDKMISRRNIFRHALHGTFAALSEARDVFRQAAETRTFFVSDDKGSTLSRHYPRELFEDEAGRLGIDIDKVGIDEAVRMIFESNGHE